jgi:UDP-N-acetylmuramoylalanine--D-glutamate ligase
MIDLKGKKVSIIGAVRSGIGAAKLVKKVGGIPFVSDMADDNKIKDSIAMLNSENISFEMGIHSEKVYNCDLMVVSPGVPADSAVLKFAKEKNIKMVSEIELAYHHCNGNVIAITGTNGKTTTTSLCGYLFNQCGVKTYTAGNIGLAFSEIALDVKPDEYVSLEVSSFQLDLIENFKPKIAMILNITPDHLNRYENSIQKYAGSKQRVYANQDENDFLILNADSQSVSDYLQKHKSRDYFFSTSKTQKFGCYAENDKVFFAKDGQVTFSCDRKDIFIKGEHNLSNAMAVINTAKILGFDNEQIVKALKSFQGVEHRLELVREINGVKFINDSKATNVDSVWYALRSFDKPIFLILGGQDKGNDYNQIKDLVEKKVKKIYAIGSSAEKVFNFFHKLVKVEMKPSMEDVIMSAVKEAREGEIVLLSPACASFDMYNNYEHRGNIFKEAVNKL